MCIKLKSNVCHNLLDKREYTLAHEKKRKIKAEQLQMLAIHLDFPSRSLRSCVRCSISIPFESRESSVHVAQMLREAIRKIMVGAGRTSESSASVSHSKGDKI